MKKRSLLISTFLLVRNQHTHTDKEKTRDKAFKLKVTIRLKIQNCVNTVAAPSNNFLQFRLLWFWVTCGQPRSRGADDPLSDLWSDDQ